jgi:hypothetical protein
MGVIYTLLCGALQAAVMPEYHQSDHSLTIPVLVVDDGSGIKKVYIDVAAKIPIAVDVTATDALCRFSPQRIECQGISNLDNNQK